MFQIKPTIILIIIKITIGITTILGASQSFIPDEIIIPIHKITLSSELDNSGLPSGQTYQLYECSTTNCMINLINSDQINTIENQMDKNAIPIGTYHYMTINSCDATSNQFNALIKGFVTINNTEYYTSSPNVLSIQDRSYVAQALELPFNHCHTNYALHTPLNIQDSVSSKIHLIIDNTGIAIAFHDESAPENFNCIGSALSGTTAAVCLNFPHLVPIVNDSQSIQAERYHLITVNGNDSDISNQATPNALIVLYTTDSTTTSPILGGFVRYFAQSNSLGSTTLDISNGKFETSIKTIEQTSGTSTISFDTFDHPVDEANPTTTDYLLQFTNFQRQEKTETGLPVNNSYLIKGDDPNKPRAYAIRRDFTN